MKKERQKLNQIQKSATGITFSTISLLLTLFCSEVTWRKWRVFQVTVIASWEHSAEHHRQGRWSTLLKLKHYCVHAWRRKGTSLNICCKQSVLFRATRPQNRLFFIATHSLPKETRRTLRV